MFGQVIFAKQVVVVKRKDRLVFGNKGLDVMRQIVKASVKKSRLEITVSAGKTKQCDNNETSGQKGAFCQHRRTCGIPYQ